MEYDLRNKDTVAMARWAEVLAILTIVITFTLGKMGIFEKENPVPSTKKPACTEKDKSGCAKPPASPGSQKLFPQHQTI